MEYRSNLTTIRPIKVRTWETRLLEAIEKEKFGSNKEDEVAGFFVFSHISMRGYFRLGLVSAPQGLEKEKKASVRYEELAT